MKFGVRECADVVFRAKANQKIGNRIFYKNEPVIYFDTLKTSSLEGAATTVYAQGGRGNPRLMSWDGERTVTFTMEDALISPMGLAILSGAGLIEANTTDGTKVIQHVTEPTDKIENGNKIKIKARPYEDENDPQETIYVMKLTNGEIDSEPILYVYDDQASDPSKGIFYIKPKTTDYTVNITLGTAVLVDYYTAYTTNAFEVNITPDKFGGAFYMEASTLWRDQATQKDYAAEFVIPNLRVQSNFTFTMASSGDPSSFTFTCDAFPDYTRFDKTKKVLAQIQILGASLNGSSDIPRTSTTSHDYLDPVDDTIKPGPRDTTGEKKIYAKTDKVIVIDWTDTESGSTNIDVDDYFDWTGASTVTLAYAVGTSAVAELDANHKITAKANGATTITATSSTEGFTGQSAFITIVVQNKPAS